MLQLSAMNFMNFEESNVLAQLFVLRLISASEFESLVLGLSGDTI